MHSPISAWCRNHLTTHFSEHIPLIKHYMTVFHFLFWKITFASYKIHGWQFLPPQHFEYVIPLLLALNCFWWEITLWWIIFVLLLSKFFVFQHFYYDFFLCVCMCVDFFRLLETSWMYRLMFFIKFGHHCTSFDKNSTQYLFFLTWFLNFYIYYIRVHT